MKLNLASAEKRLDGFINVDVRSECKPDVTANLFTPDWWKAFGESSVDEIYCGHFVEHIPHEIPGCGWKDGFYVFFDACYHVLKPQGKMTVKWPSPRHFYAHLEPTHRRTLEPLIFRYLDITWRRSGNQEDAAIACDFSFDGRECWVSPVEGWKEMAEKQKAYMMTYNVNVVAEEQVILTAHKPAREGREYRGR